MPARSLLLMIAWWLVAISAATAPSAQAAEAARADDAPLIVYVREGCPHCRDAKAYLETLGTQRPELTIVLRDVGRDPVARVELETRSRLAGIWPPGVPTFVYRDRTLVGFATAERSGPDILALLAPTDAPAAKDGDDTVDAPLFGRLSVSELGLPLFTLALGLLDGFNPCATWVLLFLLSLLVRLQNRTRMILIAGTFVLVSGAVYYAFMAAWLNVFMIIGWSTGLRWGLGALAILIGAVNVKDFVAFGRGISMSIPDRAKPGLYARVRSVLNADAIAGSMLAVAALAVVVNFVELLCTAGLPALYTAVLTQQALAPWQHYAYLGLYILGYIADDALMVGVAVMTLSRSRLTERGGRWLKLLSGTVMLMLGGVLILRPQWLF
ncbi:MAG: glutaredoxin family protein [Nevskiales bacterium]|nr:glutaredoxin family protein [Nevskiales bacterium]